MLRRAVILGAAALGALCAAGMAHTATIVVTTTDDPLLGADGECSLREAVKAANTNTPSTQARRAREPTRSSRRAAFTS
jgi:CSLREA domain-containing protein